MLGSSVNLGQHRHTQQNLAVHTVEARGRMFASSPYAELKTATGLRACSRRHTIRGSEGVVQVHSFTSELIRQNAPLQDIAEIVQLLLLRPPLLRERSPHRSLDGVINALFDAQTLRGSRPGRHSTHQSNPAAALLSRSRRGRHD